VVPTFWVRLLEGLTKRTDSSGVETLQHSSIQCDHDGQLRVSMVFSGDRITSNVEFVPRRVARTVGDVTC